MGAIVDIVYQSSSSGDVSKPIVLTMSCICTVSPLNGLFNVETGESV